ncbi:hypothetical protein E9529_19380 [Blastococcus sp. KM273128]|uniref:hypothetical protein n=1 Tax=Blastococcus sp. KM273128 TaxID=2570314 RepID=UPI001F1E9BF2|nr:hypothetical protein [Blastococcus sp. KM273128]MCF6746393.1 hypothetical protein [Blastococcus sp. KM273128]
MTEPRPASRRPSAPLVVSGLLALAVAVGAFVVLDPILAAAVAIGALTVLALAAAARNWESHATFEERELARARRRKERWESNADARARDRARWEAHQARRAARDSSSR